MDRDERLRGMEVLIGSRLPLGVSTVSGSNVLADNPRDIAGDTAGAIGVLANNFLERE